MSLPQQGADVAKSVIAELKGQPVCLALLVICAALVAFMFYSKASDNEARKILLDRVLSEQHYVQELLTRCVVPPKATTLPLNGTD